MGVLLAMPCFGEEGDRPSAGSMVYAVTYCTVFSVDLHHTTHYTCPALTALCWPKGQMARISGYWCTITDALNLFKFFQLPAEA